MVITSKEILAKAFNFFVALFSKLMELLVILNATGLFDRNVAHGVGPQ